METVRHGWEITYISDGGWDYNPRNAEVRFGLTLEHLANSTPMPRYVVLECLRTLRPSAKIVLKPEQFKRQTWKMPFCSLKMMLSPPPLLRRC